MTRAKSQSSIALGWARWAGSGMAEGATKGSQSPVDQRPRAPMWVIWIITAAPWEWTSSASSASQRTTSSLCSWMLPKACGLSRSMTEDPPIIVIAMPPLAFSAW